MPSSSRPPDQASTDLSAGARVGVYVVALAAAILSFAALSDLAWSTGSRGYVLGYLPVSWLLPVALDAAAGVGTYVWRRARRVEVVRLARRIVWSAIALSILGNATQHAHAAAGARPGVIVAIAVGAVAPAVFGAVVHLAVVASGQSPTRTATDGHTAHDRVDLAVTTEGSAPGEDRALVRRDMIDGDLPLASGDPVDQHDHEPTGPVHGPPTLVEAARALLDQPDPPGNRALARELDVTRHRARQLVIEVEDGLREVAS